jgi:hypothetical protein
MAAMAKGKRGKKRSINEAFVDEESKPEGPEDEMNLVSNLTETPTFLAGFTGVGPTTSGFTVS